MYNHSVIRRLYIHNFRCLENFELPISGKSSVLLIGTRAGDEVVLTVTAATVRPVQLRFARTLGDRELRAAVDAAIPYELYLDDVHGSPAHRKHLTHHFAQEICRELFAS